MRPASIPVRIDLRSNIHGRRRHHGLTGSNDSSHGFFPNRIMPRAGIGAERLFCTAYDIFPRHIFAWRRGRRCLRLLFLSIRQRWDFQSPWNWRHCLAAFRRTGNRPHRQKGQRRHERGYPLPRWGNCASCVVRHSVASKRFSHHNSARHGVRALAVKEAAPLMSRGRNTTYPPLPFLPMLPYFPTAPAPCQTLFPR